MEKAHRADTPRGTMTGMTGSAASREATTSREATSREGTQGTPAKNSGDADADRYEPGTGQKTRGLSEDTDARPSTAPGAGIAAMNKSLNDKASAAAGKSYDNLAGDITGGNERSSTLFPISPPIPVKTGAPPCSPSCVGAA